MISAIFIPSLMSTSVPGPTLVDDPFAGLLSS